MDQIVTVEVLECSSGVSKKGRAYNIALVRLGERVGKIFSDVALEVSNKPVKVKIAFAPNSEMFLSAKIAAKA